MRKLLPYILLFPGFFIRAQDKVYFLDGSSKEGKITSVASDYITLELEGQAESLARKDLLLLAFENGQTEILNKPAQSLIYNPSSQAGNHPKVEVPNDLFDRNLFSVNTLALCNADVSGFYEHLLSHKKIGLGLMGAYNFNPYVTFPNLFIAVLENAKKQYDLGAYANFYVRGLRKKTTFYYGILFKYTSFTFTDVIEQKVTTGSAVSTNIKYRPAAGSQFATLFTLGTHTRIGKSFFIRSLFGIGGFNMRGDYRQQYNYFLNKANQASKNPSPVTYDLKFLLKAYIGLNMGFSF